MSLFRANWAGLLGIPGMIAARGTYPRRISAAEMRRLLRRHRISAREIALQD
jgi:hypothetical protein